MRSTPHVLIIGGHGRMGRLFGAAFKAMRCRVKVIEKKDCLDPSKLADADFVMISVPMKNAEEVAASAAPHVRKDALLFDINSLKTGICRVMEDSCPGEVVGTHPMFGPTVETLRGQKMVFCAVRAGVRSDWLRSTFREMGLDVVDSTPAEHDRMMAMVQVLTHFNKMILAESWRRSGVPVQETLHFVSPIYRLELAVTGRLFAQDPELYAEIEMANPYAEEMRSHLINAADELGNLLKSGDRHAFCDFFRNIQRYLHGFSEEAMSLSDGVVKFMVEQPELKNSRH